eukprot:gene13219-biopygen14078
MTKNHLVHHKTPAKRQPGSQPPTVVSGAALLYHADKPDVRAAVEGKGNVPAAQPCAGRKGKIALAWLHELDSRPPPKDSGRKELAPFFHTTSSASVDVIPTRQPDAKNEVMRVPRQSLGSYTTPRGHPYHRAPLSARVLRCGSRRESKISR